MSLPRYEKYKESGAHWLGQVPAHWTVGRLKTQAALITEKAAQRTHPVALENIESWSGKFIPSEGGFEGEGIAFLASDILFGKLRPYLAKAYLAERPGEAVGDFHVLRPVAAMHARYLQYQILNRAFIDIIDGSTFGSKMPRASWECLGNMTVALPPVGEQTAIAAFLDRETVKIDALIAEQKKLIALLAEKRQATISHAVTKGLNPEAPMKDSGVAWLGDVPQHWKVGKAGFYISVLPGYAFPSTGFSLDDSNFKLLRGINVGVGELKWDEVVYWSRTEDDGLAAFELQEGDVVIGMDRPLISSGMRVALVKKQDLPCLLLQRVAKVKPGALLDGRFIMRLLSSRAFEAHFAPETTGVSVPHISGEQISSFVIPVPPLNEQQLICDFLETEFAKLVNLTCEAELAITLLRERRCALIAAAVTGQIDVRGAVPQASVGSLEALAA